MPTVQISLPPVTDRRQSPVFTFVKQLTAEDLYRFKAGWNLEVPNHWELIRLHARLHTTADVANRYFNYQVYKASSSTAPGLELVYSFQSDAITASKTEYFRWNRNGSPSSGTVSGCLLQLNSLSSFLVGDDEVYMWTSNIQTGDEISYSLEFRWLNWELGMDPPGQPVISQSKKGWFW